MTTKIFSANIIIGSENEQRFIVEKQPVKKLPVNILCSSEDFIRRIISAVGENIWTSFNIDRTTKLPKIKIQYLKHLGNCNKEPDYHEYGC